jgi:hypothetical protein
LQWSRPSRVRNFGCFDVGERNGGWIELTSMSRCRSAHALVDPETISADIDGVIR